MIDIFRKKGATNKKTALTLKELGLPLLFKHLMRSPLAEKLPFIEVDGKYYLSEKKAETITAMPFQKWIRYSSRVPRGFLRYQVLQFLKERPMSGSEISSRIEEETDGAWKPSPGSLYPLLSSLKTDGFIEDLPIEGGIKRYKMTELGQSLLDEGSVIPEMMRKKFGSSPFPFVPFLELPNELSYLLDDSRRIFEALLTIIAEVGENPTTEHLDKVKSAMKSSASKLEKALALFESD